MKNQDFDHFGKFRKFPQILGKSLLKFAFPQKNKKKTNKDKVYIIRVP